MRLPGTELNKSEITLAQAFFEKGEILTDGICREDFRDKENPPNKFIVIGKTNDCTYQLETYLEGEELQIALDHYQFLVKHNIIG